MYPSKEDCSRYISKKENPPQLEKAQIAGTKQGRRAVQTNGPVNRPANSLVVVLTRETRQNRRAQLNKCQPHPSRETTKWDVNAKAASILIRDCHPSHSTSTIVGFPVTL
jgi:hypothetical protein